ncbi:hemolysin D [Bosea vaviloviae]|uniref:Hemolysin D n=1 Tax=Bosea vaviloviae TaxID=1526658 RepID=A0A0N1F604_9HYPH|nr:efflux RND transporter periplasmic adaptor subunit [Bosea vaviloviae]KPH81413.1 hemolysin D [Bosea vaviloviae]
MSHAGHFPTISAALAALLLSPISSSAQTGAGGPPVVGFVAAELRSVNETTEINGRIQAVGRVDLIARVSAFLERQLIVEGAEVRKGDLLFQLEKAPFEAAVEVAQAGIAQAQAQLENASMALARAEELFKSNAGSKSALDNAQAAQRTAAAQLRAAQAQLHQAEINLGYTDIRAPIDGRIGRAAITVGNVVGPSSGVLATIVSQDPIYVTFPVSVRRAVDLRQQFARDGGFGAVRIQLRLPDGRLYGNLGKLDYWDINVARDTDSITLRGVIPNPTLPGGGRELTNDQLVRVILEAVKPKQVLVVPRVAVLSDQQGDYVYVVDGQDTARQRRVKLGQSTAGAAAVVEGLSAGERVVVEGLQRVRPDSPVAPTLAGEVPGAKPSAGRS